MRFSVIIPLFNKAPYVQKTLESVIGQSFRDFELIVVDDGSTDDSFAVARSVLKDCGIVHHLIHQENAGVSLARNNGVAVSRGEYLCFLDADDWWAPTFLEEMDVLIGEYPDAGIYGTNYYYVKNGMESVCIKAAETGYIDYFKVYADGLKMPLTSISVSVPKTVFTELNGFPTHVKLGEDFMLWVQIALLYKVAFLNVPLAYYNQDVDPTWRGIGHLVPPKVHMLWNLDFLSDVEKDNPEFKRLLDNLRTYSLLPYYLSKPYHEEAGRELEKVDWNRQPSKVRALYKKPIWFLKLREVVFKVGSKMKKICVSSR